jgi:D-alanyl-D-alanine carboxypeptidase/D-alanyl-D-alanine-endopeptidase (penicillin-binding protein 4)
VLHIAPISKVVQALITALLITGDSTPDLRAYIDSLLSQPKVSSANWSVLVFNPRTGDTLYSLNAGKNLIPASSMKAVTGATALARLGANFQYRTAFVATGPIRDSVLYGNLDVY